MNTPIYYSNGRMAMQENASHNQLYRPNGQVALYLSNDAQTGQGASTNYYRAESHRIGNWDGTVNFATFEPGNIAFGYNLYFPNGSTIVINNNCHYFGKDNGGTFQAVIGLLNDNQIHVGYSGHNTCVRGQCYTFNHITPAATNAQYSGTSSLAWFQCWAYGFPNPSDRREKDDIHDLPECLALVRAIQPKRFRWNHGLDQSRTHWGFIAQDVGETMRDAGLDFGGHIVSEDGREGLASHELVAVLWRAVQELSEEVSAMRTRLEDMAVKGNA